MTLELVVFQQQIIGEARRVERAGRPYLVAPAVSLREMVVNNELVLIDEFGRIPAIWNGIPVVINHPLDAAGNPISANQPEIADIGRVYHAHLDDSGALNTELWLDLQAAALSEPAQQVVAALEAGQMLEQSLAWYRELEITPGVRDGVAYIGVARNLVPDHLAILMDGRVGACGIVDGCGVLRVHEDNSMDQPEQTELEEQRDQDSAELTPDLAAILARLDALTARIDGLAANAQQPSACRQQALATLAAAGLDTAQFEQMPDDALQVLARKLSPADYTGRGGAAQPGAPRVLDMPAIWN